MNEVIIDGRGAILGRLASYAAKQSLLGKKIVIVNCDKVVISGKPKSIIGEYREKRNKGGSSLKGPFFPKHPERVVKRTIRGMLPYKKGNGKEALKRVMCYAEIPGKFSDSNKIKSGKEKTIKTIDLKSIGGKI